MTIHLHTVKFSASSEYGVNYVRVLYICEPKYVQTLDCLLPLLGCNLGFSLLHVRYDNHDKTINLFSNLTEQLKL